MASGESASCPVPRLTGHTTNAVVGHRACGPPRAPITSLRATLRAPAINIPKTINMGPNHTTTAAPTPHPTKDHFRTLANLLFRAPGRSSNIFTPVAKPTAVAIPEQGSQDWPAQLCFENWDTDSHPARVEKPSKENRKGRSSKHVKYPSDVHNRALQRWNQPPIPVRSATCLRGRCPMRRIPRPILNRTQGTVTLPRGFNHGSLSHCSFAATIRWQARLPTP